MKTLIDQYQVIHTDMRDADIASESVPVAGMAGMKPTLV